MIRALDRSTASRMLGLSLSRMGSGCSTEKASDSAGCVKPSAPRVDEGSRQKISRRRRVASSGWAAAAAFVALFVMCSPTHAFTLYVQPKFIFDSPYFSPPTPWEPSISQAWADVQAQQDYCVYNTGGYTSICYTVLNLHVNNSLYPAIVYNNTVNYYQWFDRQSCYTTQDNQTTCNTFADWEPIQAAVQCPPGFGSAAHAGTDSNPRHDTVWCQGNFADSQPPATRCESCIGNPIYAGSGEKVQMETDYANGAGLSFARTYRSSSGSWSSLASSAFIDSSQAYATLTNGCYPSYYTNPNQRREHLGGHNDLRLRRQRQSEVDFSAPQPQHEQCL